MILRIFFSAPKTSVMEQMVIVLTLLARSVRASSLSQMIIVNAVSAVGTVLGAATGATSIGVAVRGPPIAPLILSGLLAE